MKWILLASLAFVAGAVSGCGSEEMPATEALSLAEACAEIKGPMLTPVDDVDAGHREAIALLRDVGKRGDDKVAAVFGEAADALEYVYQHGGVADGTEPEVPGWVDDARDRLASECWSIIDG